MLLYVIYKHIVALQRGYEVTFLEVKDVHVFISFVPGMFVSNVVEWSENTERVTWSNTVRRRDGEMETLYQLREQPQA